MHKLPETEETTLSRREAFEKRLARMEREEEEQTQARREGRKRGELTQSLIDRLRACNPLQLQSAIKLCREFLRDHREPPQRRDCFHRGRKPVMSVAVGNRRYQLELLSCNKPACKKCPHGPYLYGYHRDGSIFRPTYYGKRPYRKKAPRKVLAAIRAYTEKYPD